MLKITRISSRTQKHLMLRFFTYRPLVCSLLQQIVTPAMVQPFTGGPMADSNDFRISTHMMLKHGNSLLWEKRFV